MTAVAIPETYCADATPYVETDYGGRIVTYQGCTWLAYRRYEGRQQVAGWDLTLLRDVRAQAFKPAKPTPAMSWADVVSRVRGPKP